MKFYKISDGPPCFWGERIGVPGRRPPDATDLTDLKTGMNHFLQRRIALLALMVQFALGAQEGEPPRTMVVHRALAPLQIDGVADEESWGKTPYSEEFVDIEGVKKPKYPTRVRMLWDENYLYFHAELEEPHVWGSLKQRDTVIFHNNDFEIFLDPDGDTHNYYEFEINALGTVWDLFLAKPYREGGPVLNHWDIAGLKTAVSVQGSLNDPTDLDRGWSVEVAMPWAVLKEASGSNDLPIGRFWRINFSRVNWEFELRDGTYARKRGADGKLLPEYNWVWSPQGAIDMHRPEHWGYVYFSPHGAGQPDVFDIPRDEEIRWLLYDLYRGQKRQLRERGAYAATLAELGIETRLGDSTEVQLELELHNGGWTIQAKSPFSPGLVHRIAEDGKYVETTNWEQR